MVTYNKVKAEYLYDKFKVEISVPYSFCFSLLYQYDGDLKKGIENWPVQKENIISR